MTHLAFAMWAALCVAPVQEKFDESKHPWTKWKPGAYATYKIAGDFGGQKFEGEMKQALKEKSGTEYTTTQTQSIMGQENESTEVEQMPVASGTETLTVDGKSFDCTIWKSKSKKDGTESESKVWVPKGGNTPLKIVTGGEDSAEFVAEKVGVKVKGGDGKEYTCVVLTGKIKSQGGDLDATFHFSPDVPGGIVKIEMKMGEQGGMTYELTEWKDGN